MILGERWQRGALCTVAVALAMATGAASSSAAGLEPTPLPALPGDEREPNDNSVTASPIASGERVRANLLAADDVDYYAFAAAAGDRVFANVVTAATAGSSTDSELRLFGQNGTTVLEFDDNNGSQLAFASSIAGASLPTAGIYYLAVENFGSEAATELPYDLYFQLRSGTSASESEPNDSPGTADPLGDGVVAGARNPASGTESDFYSMELEAGDTVFLSLDLDPERDGTNFDGRLGFGLAGDANNQILLVNDAGESEAPSPTIPSEAITMTVSSSGTYFAYVDAASAAVGGPTATYSLSATVLPAAQPACRTYESYFSGSFLDGGGITFGIPVEDPARIARAAVRLDLTETVMADLDVSLRSPGGSETPLFSDIGSTVAGGQQHMEAVFDEFAAAPPAYTPVRPLMLQTEIASRLNWLEGEQAEGDWALVVRDDNPNGSTGSAAAPELILCPQPPDPVAKSIFAASFEQGAEGFTHTGTEDEWELGVPATPGTTTSTPVAALDACAEGVGCFKTDLDGTYNASSSQDLVSPPISLAGLSGPLAVSWEQWHQMEAARSDHLTVSIEEDGGGNPRSLYTWLGPTMASALGNVVINPNRPAASGWARHRVEISDFAGKAVRLRFHLDSNAENNYAGLAIDDVRVFVPGEPPPTGGPGGGDPARVEVPAPRPLPPPPIARTSIVAAALKPPSFRAAARGPSVVLSRAKPGATGSGLSYRLPQAATVSVIVYRLGKGHRPSRVGGFKRSDKAGKVQLLFSGRVNGKPLAPGRYRMTLVAQAPRKAASATLRLNFRILP